MSEQQDFRLGVGSGVASEANRAVLIDRQGQARRLRLPLEPDGRSLMDLVLEAETVDALAAEIEGLANRF